MSAANIHSEDISIIVNTRRGGKIVFCWFGGIILFFKAAFTKNASNTCLKFQDSNLARRISIYCFCDRQPSLREVIWDNSQNEGQYYSMKWIMVFWYTDEDYRMSISKELYFDNRGGSANTPIWKHSMKDWILSCLVIKIFLMQ